MTSNSDNSTPSTESGACAQCGASLPPDAPKGICPQCLMNVGLESVGDPEETPTVISEPGTRVVINPKPHPRDEGNNLQLGQLFGDYRIGQLLGKGGMGEVYEAEDVESGRRVAIKVLGLKIDSPDARKRFLREGRMAAAINHPNSVYIYGTEEIENQSVIAMELVERGTLKEKLKARGTLPVAEAVDDMLQVIEGLNAAHEKGVLHRDIKPSNCFVDTDGSVKVGDFGLSVSSISREDTQLTMTGTVMGTPAFASPEQLRGDPLDVGSDIYSVGATLYYLLTGKAPFEAQNVVQLVATVLDKKPESPRALRKEVPGGLEAIILKCLAKQPDARFKDYDSLRRALTPFGSRAATPASLGLRFIAGGIDAAIFQFFVFMPLWLTTFDLSGGMNRPGTMAVTSPSQIIFSIMLLVLYLSVPEGRWGASLGKAICQIKVVGLQGSRLGIPRAAVRTLICHLFLTGPALIYSWVSTDGTMAMTADSSLATKLMSVSSLVMMAILFCKARRSNGFAGLHDLATGARVIGKHAFQKRPKVDALDDTMPELDSSPLIGPYHALGSFDAAAPGEIIPGFDLKLRRRVWIRKAGEGSSMLSREERSRNRIGRIRWINGSRAPRRCWDAYEALSGRPLATMLSAPQSWKNVRYWMLDLLTEFRAAALDASLPETIGADRIWITEDGRAKLLHFVAPGVSEDAAKAAGIPTVSGADLQAGPFVKAVADVALAGNGTESGPQEIATPPPLHARTLIESIANDADEGALVELRAATERRADVSVYRRLGLVFFSAAPALFACAALALGVYFVMAMQQGRTGSISPLHRSLYRLHSLQSEQPPVTGWKRKHVEAFEVYIPGKYRDLLTNSNEWNGVYATALIKDDLRDLANELIAREPRPSSLEIEAAEKTIATFLKNMEADMAKNRNSMKDNMPEVAVMVSSGAFLFLTIIPGLIAALAFRGGLLLRLLGLAFVTRTGAAAPRWRVFLRNLLIWAPIAVLPWLYKEFLESPWPLVYIIVYGVGFLISMISPSRGLQDRIAGTYLVPR